MLKAEPMISNPFLNFTEQVSCQERHITSANTFPLKSKSLSQKAVLYNKRLKTTT